MAPQVVDRHMPRYAAPAPRPQVKSLQAMGNTSRAWGDFSVAYGDHAHAGGNLSEGFDNAFVNASSG